MKRKDISEDEAIDRLLQNFRDDLCEQLKFVKLCHKRDWDGDKDGLLWHFTRFTTLRKMLIGREIWLSDLAFSNDANEVLYGLARANTLIRQSCEDWSNRKGAKLVIQQMSRVVKRARRRPFHNYAFSLSTERDTVQHWNGYGGGLNIAQDPDNPYVAIGFCANELFYPLELSCEDPPIYMINTVSGDDAADGLANYWAIKARTALKVLENQRVSMRAKRLCELFEHLLVFACSLVKNDGWKDENEYRLLYITRDFGDEHSELPKRPDGKGRYVPLKWDEGRSPISKVVAHPLADAAAIKRALRKIPDGQKIAVKKSELKPRPLSR